MNRIPTIRLMSRYFKHAEMSAEHFFNALEECKDDEAYIRQLFIAFKANYELVSFIEHEIEGAFIAHYDDAGPRFRQRMDNLRMLKVRLISSYHEYLSWYNKFGVPDFNDDLPF